MAPALFAKALSAARPLVKFDAWAHHPYSDIGASPTQKVRYPNVNLVQIPTFDRDLDKWFKRKVTAIWITEYGFQTKPGQPKGVTPATQAAYVKQAFAIVKKYPHVTMFIWFIFRDEPVSLWHSGLLDESAVRKPGYAAFTAAAKPFDVRSPLLTVKAGGVEPDGPGARVGAATPATGQGRTSAPRSRSTYRGKDVGVSQPAASIGVDGYVAFKVPITKAKLNGVYRVFMKIGDINGNFVNRTATVDVR